MFRNLSQFNRYLSLLMCCVFFLGLMSPALGAKVPTTNGYISGTVKNTAGAVVVGAKLTATNTTTGVSIAPVQTGSTGTYKITAPAGSYSVKCEATGYQTVTQSATVLAGKTVTLNFTLTPVPATTGILTGTVTNAATGAAIAGAAVTAGSYSAVADSTGKYTISNMTPASYTVACSAAGYVSQSATVNITAGVTTTKNFALAPTAVGGGILTGKVSSPTGGGIAGAVITAGSYTVTSDALGNYTINNIAAGTYTVYCEATGYATEAATATITSGATTTLNFALRLTDLTIGFLTGKVSDAATAAAIVGAQVWAVGADGRSFGPVQTDSKGNYDLGTIPAQSYAVNCSATAYEPASTVFVVKGGVVNNVNFLLNKVIYTTGTLTGKVTATSGAAIAGASVVAGTASATTGADGSYSIPNLAPATYAVTASAPDFTPVTQNATIAAGATTTTNFILAPVVHTGEVSATPNSFIEGSASAITLRADVGAVTAFQWSQVSGPKVPLAVTDASLATADVSGLQIAAETELVFRLVHDGVQKDVTVFVQPNDMVNALGPNVQIGGSTLAAAKFLYNNVPWALFNVGNALKATPISTTKGAVYSVSLPGIIRDINVVTYNRINYAILAVSGAGVAVVDLTNPTAMKVLSTTPVNYAAANLTWCTSSGVIETGQSAAGIGFISSVESDGTTLYIGDLYYGIHKTALANVIPAPVKEADGTLKIDAEVFTLQYAAEEPWGGVNSMKLLNGKIYAGMGQLGLGIYDGATLARLGKYNLYTDVARLQDFFGPMDITKVVGKDPVTGVLYLDAATGMPDYRQVQYEIKNKPVLTPWSDFDRDGGEAYYLTQDVDVLLQAKRLIAYTANALGGVLAIDVTTASAPKFLGFFPSVPPYGPDDNDSLTLSLLSYGATEMLLEGGVTSVDVSGTNVFATNHSGGLVIISGADKPDVNWHGPNAPYNNDTDGIPNNNVPNMEDVTSYDMSYANNSGVPVAFYESPSLLATGELNGHGWDVFVVEPYNLTSAGTVDVMMGVGMGGMEFLDVLNTTDPLMENRFREVAYFPTTGEIGAAVDGSATQPINIGHTDGVIVTRNNIYVSDGSHGLTAWITVDANGFMLDGPRVIANTWPESYPTTLADRTVYPAAHAIRANFDPLRGKMWTQCTTYGMRAAPVADVEAGLAVPGAPLLMPIYRPEIFEHMAEFTLPLPQDNAYDVAFMGNYAILADGQTGLVVYDVTKDPANMDSGYLVSYLGYNGTSQPVLGTALGVELYTNAATGRTYALVAGGSTGISVVDVTNPAALSLVKVFAASESLTGAAQDVYLIGDKAYFTYYGGGLLIYNVADLIGSDPAPRAIGQFKITNVPGFEASEAEAYRATFTTQNGKIFFYIAYGDLGVVKVDVTNPATPVFLGRADTVGLAKEVAAANGRLYVADGKGGLVFLK